MASFHFSASPHFLCCSPCHYPRSRPRLVDDQGPVGDAFILVPGVLLAVGRPRTLRPQICLGSLGPPTAAHDLFAVPKGGRKKTCAEPESCAGVSRAASKGPLRTREPAFLSEQRLLNNWASVASLSSPASCLFSFSPTLVSSRLYCPNYNTQLAICRASTLSHIPINNPHPPQ